MSSPERQARQTIASGGAILAAHALGADLAYIGTRFIASEEANAPAEYKQMIIDSRAEDIVYTNLVTGERGNYLKGSIVNAGLDPESLPESEKTKMDFGLGSAKAKAWRDIWGAGLDVADRALFVYANGIKDDGPFDDVLRFRTKIIAYDGDAGWVEPTLIEVAACLDRGNPPEPDPECAYCSYAERVARFGAAEAGQPCRIPDGTALCGRADRHT